MRIIELKSKWLDHWLFRGFSSIDTRLSSTKTQKSDGQACKLRFSTKYIRLPDLLVEYDEEMLMRKNAKKLLKRYSTYSLLIIDEWLMDDISEKEQHFIFELIERRHEQSSTIFCTQYKREDWFDRLGGGVHADAILDRIVHNAIFVETGSMNMREYCSKLSN